MTTIQAWGFGLCALLASGLVSVMFWRLEGLIRSIGARPMSAAAPRAETLTTVEDFVERLERLASGCIQMCVLDVTNMTRHLVVAPRFLSTRCAPRLGYRQVSNIDDVQGFQALVQLIRRSAPAEEGTYFCLRESSWLSAWGSFCLIEREDGFYIFLVRRLTDRGTADVVLIHDETLGRLMLRQYESLWGKLAESGSPLFAEGRLNEEREASLVGAPDQAPVESRAPRQLRAA